MPYRTPVQAAVAASILISTPVQAQDETTVEPVVVTATRTAQTADESLSSVTVLERRDIQRSQVQSLPDLLSRQRGISITSNGPYGKDTNLYMRGTNSDHVLVLIDGVKMGSATLGSTAFQHLPLEQIERIEIVRGPRSSLYGSEAVGGVIHIFTHRGEAEAFRASAMAGNNDSSEFTASASRRTGNIRIAGSAKAFDTEGINARTDGYPDEDGYTNRSGSFSYEQDFADATWSLRGQRAEGTSEFDFCGAFASQDCEDEFVQQVASTALEVQANPFWTVTLRAGHSRDESTLLTDGAFDSEFNTERTDISWQNDFALGSSHLVSLGYDRRRDEVDTSSGYDETERRNEAVFAQWQWAGRAADAQLSGRYDDNEAYGSQRTGSLAVGYALSDSTRIYGSYGTAFKAPTFNDLFFPFTDFGFGFTFEGNPDLEPETSESIEFGIEGGEALSWSANLFRTEIDQIIVNTGSTMENLNRAHITGTELGAAMSQGGWDVQGSVTFLETEAVTDDETDGNQLPRRPERKIDIDASRDFGRASIGGHLRYEADRFTSASNDVELEGFTLLDVRLAYDVRRDLTVEASVDNLTDVQYQTAQNFNALGRTAYLRLTYQP